MSAPAGAPVPVAAAGGVKRSHGEMEGAPATGVPATATAATPATAEHAPAAAVAMPAAPATAVAGAVPSTTAYRAPTPAAAVATPAAAAVPPVAAASAALEPAAKKPNLSTGPSSATVPPTTATTIPPSTTVAPPPATTVAPQTTTAPPPAAHPATAGVSPANMPKVQDALGYLEKVKNRFSMQPIVYNQFLDIMKDFKSQNIDTEGVIKRVKGLFRGHRSLILGFNQFLPPGYKIELEPDRRPTIEFKQAMEYVAKIKNRFREEPYIYAEFLDILHDYQAKRTIDEVYQRVQKLFKGQPDLLDEFKYFLPESAVGQPKAWPPAQKSGSAKPTTAQAAAGKTAAGAPKTVMGKPVQAKPASGTGAMQRDAQGRMVPVAAKAGVSAKPGSAVPGSKDAARPVQRDAKGNIIPPKKPLVAAPVAASSSGHHGSSHKKSHDGHREHRHHRDRESRLPAITYPPSCDKELTLFERMKQASSKAQWVQFLKALNLFAHDIISRSELLRMVEDVYGEKGAGMGVGSDWVEKFKQSIGYDEAEEKQVASLNQTNYYSFVSSVDFTICHQVTPSYRELPPQILVPHSSGRNELADEVLNDTCISIPTGSEDFSFKSTRKNIYEENLFKIEDERFELDMLIENNSAAIRVLEPLNDQIAIMPPEAAKRVRLPDTIDILHIRSIARVYGDQGYEMVELLNKSPAVAVNIILMRLKQKDVEWRKTRNEMKSTWRKVNEANYQRSLDHRSFYFKQEDKKRRSAKALVTELKEVQHAVFGSSGVQPPKASPPASATRSQAEQKDANGEVIKRPLPTPTQEDLTGDESLMLRAIKQGQKPNTLLTYCMVFKYGDAAIHQQLFDLMARVSALRSNDTDQLKALLFFQGFVSHFFGVTLKDEQNARIQALTEKVAIDEAKRKEGLSAEEAAAALELPSEREKAASESLGMDLGSEDEEEKAEEPEVAPAAAAAAATDSRKQVGKGKKKATKAKKAKKKPGSVAGKMIGGLNPASAAAAAAAIAKEKEDEELDDALDEDDDEKRGGGFSKNAKDEAAEGDEAGAAGDVSQSRLRSAAAAALAASQLSKVQGLLKKLSAAAEITDNAANFPKGIPPVGLYLDTPWLQKEAGAAAASAQSNSAAAAAASSSSSAAAAASSAKPSCPTLRDHGKSSKLFLGSHPYYVFFRLHQFLYERLHTAKQLAHKARRNSSKKKLPATPEERHTRFCVILDQLLSGELETTRFEDECRNLLGASSYVLFTIDKLIEQLVKQTVNLLSSDNSLKVLSLYQYEQRRVRTCMAQFKKNNVNAEQQKMQLSALARQYQSNIANLLGDDSACAIEYFDESHDLAMGLIEHLDETNKHSPGEEWNQFVFEYLADCPQVMLRTPFRKRSVRFATRALVRMMTQGASAKEKTRIQKEAQDTSNQELMAAALKFVYQKNTLASKLDLRSFKLHFLEHTTDVFVRRTRDRRLSRNNADALSARKQRQKKMVARFTRWLAHRFSDLPAANDSAQLDDLISHTLLGQQSYEDEEEAAAEEAEEQAQMDDEAQLTQALLSAANEGAPEEGEDDAMEDEEN